MEIVRPEPLERKEIEALFRSTITHTFAVNCIQSPEDLEDEIANQLKSLDDDFRTKGISTRYQVAKLDGVIVGTAALGPANEDIRAHLPETANLPELKSIYVLPAYQGMGIGTKLIRAMLTHLRDEGATAFVLDCGYPSAQEIWIHRFGAPTLEIINHWEDEASYMIWRIDLSDLDL